MIELSEEQKKAVAEAQVTFKNLKDNAEKLTQEHMNLLFGEARSMNGWQDKEVSDDMIKSIYELTKMGPTSTNCCPARFKFIKSEKQKQLLKDSLLPNNVDKVMTAPVIAVIGYDLDFSDHMGKLFPHMDVAPMYKGNQELIIQLPLEIALFKEHISWWSVEP
jgi:3-hydroxypropanoate dehydrogenase